MKQLHLKAGLMASALAVGFSVPAVAEQEDAAAIRQVQILQAAAWNRHDARAYANLFAEDGDAVNIVGWWWRGRPEIERKIREGFEVVFAQSTLTITDVDVRFLGPSMAVAHVRWTMVGAKASPNTPEPREGIQLQILTKQAGDWLIASFQNTNSAPAPAAPATCHHCLASSPIAPDSLSAFIGKSLAEGDEQRPKKGF
jgi:uncharacterized protein (TIGR02246 family)